MKTLKNLLKLAGFILICLLIGYLVFTYVQTGKII